MTSGARFGQNRFHLNPPTDVLDADDYVIPFSLSPGLGDRQAKACGLAHEGKFGEMASLPVVEIGWVDGFVKVLFFAGD